MAAAPGSAGPSAAMRGGSFDGVLRYQRPCPSEAGSPVFAGRIEADLILIRAARGQRLAAPVDAEGRFSTEAALRAHQLGTKMQYYVGRISDGVVTVEARFLVPGYPQTECIAVGEFPIRRG